MLKGKIMHQEQSSLAGKTVKIKPDARHPQVTSFGGSEYRVEDWWDRLGQGSWKTEATRNPACMIYAMRRIMEDLPNDDQVLYGKVGSFGHLVHISEVDGESNILSPEKA